MPGICGIISKMTRESNRRDLKLMVDCMMHEPFYTSGSYINNQLGIYVGWVCLKGSFSDCMPLWNRTKDVFLIFSGEDFADLSEIERLRIRGHECDIDNASYIVHLYKEMGLAFIEKLNGWFSGVLADLQEQKIILFNDRYGMHRIFVHEDNYGLYFSSEAKALLKVIGERGFDPKGIGEFLTCGCTLGSRSLYKGISILPTGALWSFEHGEVKKKLSYFNTREWFGQQSLDEEQFSYRVVESFGGLIKKYFAGSLPVGISLTGGLDSRMVMACLDKSSGEFPCYTFGSMYRETFDVQIARKVANACGQPHHVLVLGEEFLRGFSNYLEKAVYISDGYLGMSGAAELYVNSLARNLAPVRLTANYGGELIRGHRAFKYHLPQGGFVSPDLEPYLREAKATFQELENTDAVSFALFRQAPSQGYGRLAIERSQVILRTPFMDNGLVKLIYQAPPHLLKGTGISMGIISRYSSNLLEIPTDRGLLGVGSLLGCMIRQFHRKALIKAEYLSSHGMPNWLAAISHYGLGRFLEKSFLGRNKFQHFRLWTQKHFASYVTDVLLQGTADLEDFFNKRHIESIIREHLAGKQNYTDEIDKIMTLALGYRTLLKGVPFEISENKQDHESF